MGRFSLEAPLVSKQAVVREMDASDAESLATAAASVTVVLGRIGVPTAADAALAMLADWQGLRVEDLGNLFGVFSPSTQALVGVIGIRQTEDFVAELGAWNTRRGTARKQLAEAVVQVTAWTHRARFPTCLGLTSTRWMTSTQSTSRLSRDTSLRVRFEPRQGEIKARYSSVG